jgi:hypothetical protein
MPRVVLVPWNYRLFASFALALVTLMMAPIACAAASTLTIATKTLPTGYVNSVYTQLLIATGGSGTGYSWSVTSGKLPKGIALTATSGLLHGTPTASSSVTLTFNVKDSASNTASAKLVLSTAPALTITTKSLPTGYVSSTYSATLVATGGTSKGYLWSVRTGSLPSGVKLSAAGVLSGKPSAAGTFSVTFQVKDSLLHVAAAQFTLTVKPALAIKTTSLPEAYAGSPYSATLAATGGSGTSLAWSLTSGSLPKGLALSNVGKISGQPTQAASSTFSVAVKDSAGNTAKASFKLVVGPQLVIASAGPLPVGYADSNYSFTFTASGGSGKNYVWTTKSALPQNMVLSKAGNLSGSTPAADTVTLTIVVTDSAKNTASADYRLVIDAPSSQCTNDSQTTTLVELHGVYTFTLDRLNLSSGQIFHSVGSFNADGLGDVLNGVMDSNGPKFTAATQDTFTGTYTVGSDGRGRVDIAIPPTAVGQKALNQSFCFALDTFAAEKSKPPYGASSHAFVIEDDASNVASSGEFLAQVVDPMNSIMQGSWAFGMSGRVHYPTLLPNGPDPRMAFAGYLNFDGSGKITAGELDEVVSTAYDGKLPTPSYTAKSTIVGTYSIPTPSGENPTGRGTISATHNGKSFANFVFYPYGGAKSSPAGSTDVASGIVFLDTSVPDNGGGTPFYAAWEGTGLRRSSTTFSAASLKGSSVASQFFYVNPGLSDESEGVGIDVDQWDGAGNFTYTGDRNSASVATTDSGKGTYTVDGNGRFAVMVGGQCAPCGYLSGTNKGFAIYDAENTNLVLFEAQTVPLGGPFEIASMQGGYAFGSRWYYFPQQQTASGETVTEGQGSFTGTLDTNTEGHTDVDISFTATETTTSNSGVHGRFLYQPSNTGFPYAIYVIDKNNAVAIPLGGSGDETDPILRFIHQ